MRPVLAPEPVGAMRADGAPTFSVVIAAYNAAETIGEAVDSALGQTVAPLEVIVCDDGSTDDIEGALRPYAGRLKLLRKENGGPSSARNLAARAASGEFVAVLDADDVFLPERLEALGELGAARPDLDVLATDVYLEVDGARRGHFNGPANPFEVADQPRAILERCFAHNGALRRARMGAVGWLDEQLHAAEDWDLLIRLILSGSRAGCVDEPLAVYRMTPGSITADRARALRYRVLALEKAAARPGLEPRLRPALETSLRGHRARAEAAEAESALRSGAPDARDRSLAVAMGRGQGPTTRLKALVAALAPKVTARVLARRARAGRPSSRLERPAERRAR